MLRAVLERAPVPVFALVTSSSAAPGYGTHKRTTVVASTSRRRTCWPGRVASPPTTMASRLTPGGEFLPFRWADIGRVEVSHIGLNNGVVEACAPGHPAFSVQYHS